MEDVSHLSVLVLDQADTGISVGVVLDGLDLAEHVSLGTSEVDHAVLLCVVSAGEFVVVTGLSRSSGGHHDGLVPGSGKAPAVHVAQRLIALLGRQLLKGCHAAITQGVVLGLPDPNT